MARAKKQSNTAQTAEYSADSMRELTGLEPIRQSPAQYIGPVAAISAKNGRNNPQDGEVLTAGGFHLFVEICGNSSDEATNTNPSTGKTYADTIEITLHNDQSISVKDNGRGVPPDINKETGKSGIAMAYLSMNAGGKFKEKGEKKAGNYKNSQGLHGVGAAATTALSDRLDVTVWRGGKEYKLETRRGVPGTFVDDAIDAKFTPCKDDSKAVVIRKDTRSAAEKKAFPTGTCVHWHPDPTIWGGTDIPLFDIYEYVNAQSYMAPACTYRIIDETEDPKKPKITEYHHPGGINDMIEEKTAKGANISPVVSFDVPTSYMKSVTVETDDGGMEKREIEYDCDVKVALRWTGKSGSDIEGYANGVHCVGKHIDGFRRGITRGVNEWIKSADIMTKKDQKEGIAPNIEDMTDGMVAVVEVLLEDQCAFHGQTKDDLTNPEVLSCVSDAVKDKIGEWLGSKKNQAVAKKVGKSIIENAKLRAKQKKEREAAKKIKEFAKDNSWPAKLTNCSCYGDERAELIIVEGESAANPCRSMRDSRHQAIYPIRGKLLNCHDLPLQGKGKQKGVLDNQEAADIIKIHDRFHNIIILSDADHDGAHIETLIFTLFYKHMPEVVEEGRIFAVDAPLFVIETLGDERTYLAKNDKEKDEIVARLRKEGKKIKTPISRLKGWGECPPELVEETCLNPETRVLRRLTIEDAESAAKTLELAMGGAAEPRKEWLVEQLGYGKVRLFS